MKSRQAIGDTRRLGPLCGIRIIDLTRALAGPYCSMLLADLGAETIKVEEPGSRLTTSGAGAANVQGESTHFLAINRNKKSMVLDLKNEEGRKVFYELTKYADVVLDNYRPGVIERLGVDYDTLKAINPSIICCSLSGFGSKSPYAQRAAYDLVAQAMSGGMSITGEPPPVRAGIPLGDLGGGIFAAFGIMTALFHKERTGEGQKVETSLLDSQISFLVYMVLDYFVTGEPPSPVGSGQRTNPLYRPYKAQDKEFIMAGATPRFWPNLCNVIERPDLETDPRFDTPIKRVENKDELTKIFEEAFSQKTAEEWLNRLIEARLPCAPINNIAEILEDPHVKSQKMVVSSSYKGETIKVAGNPVKMSAHEDKEYLMPPPEEGEHTDEILSELLGYSFQDIEKLKKLKAVA
ncbi:MAG: CoA transferase [Thermodesulfobacteriota bacterium]|nr:CoA transferase [Thermodesulfobacteriota bacterium]